jgi:nitroreductase
MDALTAIFTRHSIRKYTGEPITDDQLHTILRAGFSAPTAMNTRPWQFVVVRSAETLEAITKAHPYSKMLPSAGCGILVCGDTAKNENLYYLAEDCSAAIENMLLAAHAQGLGAVWLGVHPRDERVQAMRALMELPESIFPIGMMAVGNPAETRDAPDRFEADKVHFEKW